MECERYAIVGDRLQRNCTALITCECNEPNSYISTGLGRRCATDGRSDYYGWHVASSGHCVAHPDCGSNSATVAILLLSKLALCHALATLGNGCTPCHAHRSSTFGYTTPEFGIYWSTEFSTWPANASAYHQAAHSVGITGSTPLTGSFHAALSTLALCGLQSG